MFPIVFGILQLLISLEPSLVNKCRTLLRALHLTMLDERSKAGRKREPATGSEHLLVGMNIAIPVLSSIGSYMYSNDARSCINDDCFDLPANR